MKKVIKGMMIGGLTAGLSQSVLSGMKGGMTAGSPEYESVGYAQKGISNVTSSFPVMGSIAGANMSMGMIKKLYKRK